MNRLSDGEKICIVYTLFCILFIFIIITVISTSITSSSSISFVALLNCLSQPMSFPFRAFSPPHPTGGEWEG